MTDTLKLALDYIERYPERYLFPIKAGSKFPPLIKNNLEDASNDPAQLTQWAKKHPGCNWGLAHAKSNVLVVDVDTKPGKEGEATFDGLDLIYGFPPTEENRSPSGGRHLVYEGRHIFALGKNGFGLDIDSPNYSLVPGSIVGGVAYTSVKAIPAAPAPPWFYDVLGKAKERLADAGEAAIELDQPANVEWAVDFLIEDAEPAIEGSGGDLQTCKIAMNLRDRGISEPLAYELMAEHYNPRCEPPWDADDLRKKVGNGYSYANQSKAGGKTAEADFAGEEIDISIIPTQGEPDVIAEEAQARAKPKRPTVKILPGLLHDAMDATQAILIKQAERQTNRNGGSTIADQIFQRSGHLVRLNRNLHLKRKGGRLVPVDTRVVDGVVVDAQYQEAKALTIREISAPWLTTRLGRSIEYVGPSAGKPGKKPNLKPKDVPPNLVKQLIGDETQWQFPPLFAIIEAPTLRADGSVLSEPGYDPASGMFFHPGSTTFPKINPNPSSAEGRAALRFIDDELLSSFPFQDAEGYEGVSRSVALAMLLTAPVRRVLPTAPAFAADSNEPESGKSELLKVGVALMTGREIAGHPFSENEEERRKAIGTAFSEGRPALLFDNVTSVIEGPSLEMALTMPVFEDRKLGSHEGLSAPTNTLMLFSANHLSVGGNGMSTRILASRIVPTKPLAKRFADGDFRHENLIGWVIENRPRLIAAVLTALRAFILHGPKDVKPTSRFPEWSRLIGNALVWYGYPDPVRGGDAVRRDDPVKEAQREIVREWRAIFGYEPVTAAMIKGRVEMRELIAPNLKERTRVDEISSKQTTGYVGRLVGVGLDLPYMVQRIPETSTRRDVIRWRLVPTGSPDDFGDDDPELETLLYGARETKLDHASKISRRFVSNAER
ncbi:bifunctional DNA primase/polymerase [Bradyrhizobium sp. WYCCWR 13023]|uniref:Bifunctional DNA primase/polymerase n=1 Tax=Bradyrhizobium zhengyangense TaxID=2911009 RepID=A0A9X1REU8_9BRAD|nr:bifunctional DNA primase/polymerase [Bradyrhizobium zhengyangense]MCG2628840.1 bifunctional DNA primase/polymerase [Bradyrhizobium zhengyangense]